MTWYFWVWGALSCLALLALTAGLVVLIIYLVRKDHEIVADLRWEIRQLEQQLDLQRGRANKFKAQLEVERGRNEFGPIHP